MSARALREQKFLVANDSQHDPQLVFSPDYVAASVRASAVLPLLVAAETVGVLALYTSERGFVQEELKRLTELAGLANRTLFLERVAQYQRSAVNGGHRLALFPVDLERFQNLSDRLGR